MLSVASLLLNHVFVAHGSTPAGPVAADPAIGVVPLGRNSAEDFPFTYFLFRLKSYIFLFENGGKLQCDHISDILVSQHSPGGGGGGGITEGPHYWRRGLRPRRLLRLELLCGGLLLLLLPDHAGRGHGNTDHLFAADDAPAASIGQNCGRRSQFHFEHKKWALH